LYKYTLKQSDTR